MSDDEKSADDLRAKAALAVAKHTLEHAFDDPAEKKSIAKSKRNKRIAQIAIGSLVVVGLLGLMLHYWYWSLLLGLVGVAGWYVRRRWRARRAARKKLEPAARREAPALKARIAPEPAPAPAEELDASIDEDLAELKARLKK